MVLGQLPVPGRPTIWMIVGQGPIALAIGADGGCLDIFSLIYHSFLSPSLWETVRYRLKYCLKEPLNPKQPTISYEMTTSVRFCLSNDLLKWDFIAFKIKIISIRKRIVDMDVLSDVTHSGQSVITRVAIRFL